MNYKSGVIFLLTLSSIFFFTANERGEFPGGCRAQEAPILDHTSGTIERDGSIKIRFSKPVVQTEKVGEVLEPSPLRFQPPIEGETIWSDERTLEFRPAQRLPSGKKYTATVELSRIMEGLEIFRFEFSTVKQSFDISLEGLAPIRLEEPETQQLKGSILTEDAEDGENIEKMLSALQAGESLKITWIHSENGRVHTFFIQDLTRSSQSEPVVLAWDATPLGLKAKGQRVINIPSIDTFEAVFARAVQGEEEFIEVRFTDPVKGSQDLKGLITVDPTRDLKFDVEGNTVRVFSPSKWKGTVKVRVNPGIHSVLGKQIKDTVELEVHFAPVKPGVRFIGKGVITPTTGGLSLPIEAVNLRGVVVEACRIFTDNVPQFLQVNALEGVNELHRVGSTVWKKNLDFDWSPDKKDRWVRYGLDMTPLLQDQSGGIFRITLSFKRRHVVYDCPTHPRTALEDREDPGIESTDEEQESSYWDLWEQYLDTNARENYRNRNDPCHPGYYQNFNDHKITVSRNILISDIGLIVKQGEEDRVFVAATDIRTTQPLPEVKLRVLDYRQQTVGEGHTDDEGVSMIRVSHKPFLLIASKGQQMGYLKLDDASANSVSHFDVSGQMVQKGIKGFLYGERGVWRPGDPIYLTFILMDPEARLPENHPVRFELFNPRGQLVKTLIRKESINGFYVFHAKTDPDAPTGNWRARVRVGGVSFEKILKIETVMPNRLKINLDFGEDVKSLTEGPVNVQLSARWLHGAVAKKLKSDVSLQLTSRSTRFPGYESYAFDDPVRRYRTEKTTVFEGMVDEKGQASFSAVVKAKNVSPGMLTASFTTRVFEPGGAFSTDQCNIAFHPYEQYVGVQVPAGDKARGMLLTDKDHTIRIVLVDASGAAVPVGEVEVEIYKINWRWWWERGEENLANYMGRASHRPIRKERVRIDQGRGEWHFQIKYPAWGRYLIRVRDLKGDHITGKILYIDWPGWAGRGKKEMPGGASVLSFSADKTEYGVGEKVALTIPTGKRGRGLLSIETGTKIVQTAWIEGGEEAIRYEFEATARMVPNIYVHVTFLQPHLEAGNDLPIRMYGIVPIKIMEPQTVLNPQIDAADVFTPEEKATITVSEENGKPMTYTLALVDEGLLDLTRFETPDPWSHFYGREALGVKTWDLYDEVAGAYGALLEQFLAIGGDKTEEAPTGKKAERFPPMVRFLGPFELEKDGRHVHQVEIPQYVGSVRIMVVGGQNRAFGKAEKAVFVRKPLMVLGTLPRVLGPNEEVELPVSVFALEDHVRDVNVMVRTEGPLSLEGPAMKSLSFKEPGDKLVSFRLRVGSKIGIASVTMEAEGAGEKAGHRIALDVRLPVSPVVDVVRGVISPGETWEKDFPLPGMPGTNRATLEVSRILPINLGKRLPFLIRYPHGCVEQVTSSVFPQLYLDQLIELSPEKKDKVQENVRAGIDRLRNFQTADGGFAYWPGASPASDWVTSYAGHFLVEAEKIGYLIPSDLMAAWRQYQHKQAKSWVSGSEKGQIIQAYRLYTLALAGSAELGAMNRLRESPGLSKTAKWRLGASYLLAGQPEAAEDLVQGLDTKVSDYRELSGTYGSGLRDRAMILETLCLMGEVEEALSLAEEISDGLASDTWHSTQSTAYALIAMARMAGITAASETTSLVYAWMNEPEVRFSSSSPVFQRALAVPDDATTGILKITNTSNRVLYPRVILEGSPAPGTEKEAHNGLSLKISYTTLDNKTLDPSRLEQGTDFAADVRVMNIGRRGRYEEVALSHLFPSGWEIHNERMDAVAMPKDRNFEYQDIRDDRVYTYFDLDQRKTKTFRVILNAAYCGRFYLPMVSVEAMYDDTINARTEGKWVEVVSAGQEETSDKR